MSPKRKKVTKRLSKSPRIILISGICLIGLGLLLLFITFMPIAVNEIHYHLQSQNPVTVSDTQQLGNGKTIVIKPINDVFGIVIPKIRANAAIIPNVDPYDSSAYQRALTKGVAHAKGSVFPGQVGNVFIFSHSSVNFFEALRYNSIFYLLDKLEVDDLIYVYFNKEQFIYRVTEKKLITPDQVYYLAEKTNDRLITLMTCWPPGTTFKRLIIRGILTTQP